MKARLEVTSGPDADSVFELDRTRGAVVGRGLACHFRLHDPKVSRAHLLVERGPLAYRVSDMGSLAGTILNGQEVQEHDLADGDTIRLGSTEIRFSDEQPENPKKPEKLKKLVKPESPEEPKRAAAEPRQAQPSAAPPADASRPLSELPGKALADYRIEEPIAEGKLGVVFKAHDTKRDRTVALKVLRPEFSQDPEEMKRFIRGMKTVLGLRHPNIVAVYAAGKAREFCFIAMEYVDGESLTEVIKRIGTVGMLDWSYAFRVAVHMARALEAAFEHQFIHRNIIPQNILISSKDKTAKLGDLMLAKALEGTFAEKVTRTGVLAGEVAYMSPERSWSEAGIDGRSDIYGLGATLYALLTGRPPFESKSIVELIDKIRSDEPESPKKFQLAIPDLFEGVVLRMIAKRPEDRFQSAVELMSDLERIAKYQGISI